LSYAYPNHGLQNIGTYRDVGVPGYVRQTVEWPVVFENDAHTMAFLSIYIPSRRTGPHDYPFASCPASTVWGHGNMSGLLVLAKSWKHYMQHYERVGPATNPDVDWTQPAL
jgi:hypothetical protein